MEQGAASRATSHSLSGADILGAGSFGATTLREGHLLPLPQFVEAYALDARRVEEQVFTLPRVDESKSLVGQFFDAAFWHWSFL